MQTELKKWNPLDEFGDLQTRLHHLLPSFLGKTNNLIHSKEWEPAVDIEEDDEKFLITADLPEVKKEDVKVSVADGVLSISGERTEEKESKNKTYHRIERFHGSYQRDFRLPENIDESKLDATMKSGTLRISLPKTSSPNKKPAREIEIA